MNHQKNSDKGGYKQYLESNHRNFVGPEEKYDVMGAMQFSLLYLLGLRESDYLLDIGCGSLRAGKLFIPYLLPGHYFGIEPQEWLIEKAIQEELGGNDLIKTKQPKFSNDRNFTLSIFKQNFDFILAQSVFSHASPNQISQCLAESKKVMNADSIFAATFVQGDSNYDGDEWLYPGVAKYTLEFFTELVENQGLSCKQINFSHRLGQTWVTITKPSNQKINRLDILDLGASGLREELSECRTNLAKIMRHPYVKLGFKIKNFLDKTKNLKK